MKQWILLMTLALVLSGCRGERPAEAPAPAIDGAALFVTNCAACHGDAGDGRGRVPAQVDFTSGGWQRSRSDEEIREIIRNGIPGAAMPPFRNFSEEQVEALVRHLRELGS